MGLSNDCEFSKNGIQQMDTNFVAMPKDANHYGNVHGGTILQAIDNLAYTLATQYSRMNVVTAKMSEVNFLKPVKTGNLVILRASITRVGNSSMDIQICVQGENLLGGDIFEVAQAKVVMVAVDLNGRPSPIPKLS